MELVGIGTLVKYGINYCVLQQGQQDCYCHFRVHLTLEHQVLFLPWLRFNIVPQREDSALVSINSRRAKTYKRNEMTCNGDVCVGNVGT